MHDATEKKANVRYTPQSFTKLNMYNKIEQTITTQITLLQKILYYTNLTV